MKTGNKSEVRGKRSEGNFKAKAVIERENVQRSTPNAQRSTGEGPDVCDLRCLRGGVECKRPVCTGACKLTANIKKVRAENRGDALKPCPLCGSKDVIMQDDEPDLYWAQCKACEATGPMVAVKDDAARAWNKRCVSVFAPLTNRLLESLELIAKMPTVDPVLNITRASVVAQYDEARDTAQLTLDQYARNGGIVVDRAAVEDDAAHRPSGSLAFARQVLDLAEDINSTNWGTGVIGLIEVCRAEIHKEVSV